MEKVKGWTVYNGNGADDKLKLERTLMTMINYGGKKNSKFQP